MKNLFQFAADGREDSKLIFKEVKTETVTPLPLLESDTLGGMLDNLATETEVKQELNAVKDEVEKQEPTLDFEYTFSEDDNFRETFKNKYKWSDQAITEAFKAVDTFDEQTGQRRRFSYGTTIVVNNGKIAFKDSV